MLTFVLCASCGSSRQQSAADAAQERVTILCVSDFAQLVDKHEMRVIDVRTRTEFNTGHIKGAENIDMKQPDFVDRVNARGPVAVYCRTGNRRYQAALMLAEQGIMVYDLGGGIAAWRQAGKPTEK